MQKTRVQFPDWEDPLKTVFLPGESHGQRSLAGYSPRCHKELDTTDAATVTTTPRAVLCLVAQLN